MGSRALAVVVLIVASALPSSISVSAATPPFLSLPVDGSPFIPYYVYDPWTLRMGLPTYSNITLGVPYDHSGTDYSLPLGSPVYAAAGGTILSAQDGFGDTRRICRLVVPFHEVANVVALHERGVNPFDPRSPPAGVHRSGATQ